ncbi:MAG: ABC transporter permease subunit [Alphaproteobacteria bacterium]|nr:ABC transporter permease subunit [Alphaproteobacteria bacterium]TAD91069.1 MAG: ABC transporter permease subunit [Alphaproteobacteria bacterium]
MDLLIDQFFNTAIMAQAWPILWRGLQMTLLLCLTAVPLGLLGGLLVALAGRVRALRWTVVALVDLLRAVPPLVLLLFLYAGLPFAGIHLPPFLAALLALGLNASSFYGEIWRAGIDSVGHGQWEAARSTGLGHRQTLTAVILPQAARAVLPDLVSNTIEVVKLTSLASVVALPELLYSADMARSVTYNASPLMLAAGLYLALLWPLVRLLARFEHRSAGSR